MNESIGFWGQDTVALAQLFPQLNDGFVRLRLGLAVNPVNPAFEIGWPALQQVLITFDTDMLAKPA